MKSFTDIKQSKKLAKILPFESADMHYVLIDTDENKYDIGIGNYIGILPHYPAWSLSALLNVLPYTVKDNFGREFKFKLESIENDTGYRGYRIQYYQDIECYLMTMYDYNSPIDACVEMIVTLKEKGLL